jgi:hypothetical protein
MKRDKLDPNHCEACKALYEECGPEHFDLYARRLLLRGWTGYTSAVEHAYVRAHKPLSEAQKQQLAAMRSKSKLGI